MKFVIHGVAPFFGKVFTQFLNITKHCIEDLLTKPFLRARLS